MILTLYKNRGRPMTNLEFAKLVVWLNCAVPLLMLIYQAWRSQLGADPTNFVLRTTGLCSLIFLTLSLLITPLRKLTGWSNAIAFRRTLGLYGFYYAAAHFITFFWFDQTHSVQQTISEIWTKRYLQIGFIGLAAMLPLAVTSTNQMIRRLGSARWQALHRLAYVAAIAGVVHFWMQVKSDLTRPKIFAWSVGALLAFRYVAMFFTARAKAKTQSAATASLPPTKKRFWTGELKVGRIFRETPSVCTFRLVPLDGAPLPFDYLPGQYLSITLDVDGRRVNRSYTIASSPTRSGSVEITVKRETNGTSSRHLHDRIREGDRVRISAPAGKFTFIGEEHHRIVLIAGGVGITPLMSVARYLTDRAWPGEIHFIVGARSESEIIFHRELETLRGRFPNLHVVYVLSQPGETWPGERGRISAAMVERNVPDLRDAIVHLCGPNAMMDEIRMQLIAIGVEDSKIKTEKFESPPMPSKDAIDLNASLPPARASDADLPDGNSTATVTFATAGKMAAVKGEQTILEIAEDNGLEIPFDCRAGICGTCKVRLLSGQVDMETRDALSSADETGGLILACQARPAGDVSVDV